jgi:hypothetical protein
MTLNNAMLGLLALTMFVAAAVVSMGPVSGRYGDPYGLTTSRPANS